MVTFNPDASTELSLPLDDLDLPGFTFHATVIRRLSLLHCDFVLPDDDLLKPSAFPAVSFPDILPSPLLWHCCFGHLGKDATQAALTQDYVQGAVFKGSFTHENCIACIIGKSPQHSYAHNGRRALEIGELLHMDLCGPYLTQGPRGENHFYVILDDCSNVGFTFCLRKKSDAFIHYGRTEVYLERSTGCRIKAVGSRLFVLMARWSSLLGRWVLTLCLMVLLFRRLHCMHTLRPGRLNAMFVPLRKVARPSWWIQVFLCLFGVMQSSLLNSA